MFDYYGPNDFKFAGINTETKKIIIGPQTKHGWTVDEGINRNTFITSTIYAL
jgi:hypothetical protein